MITAHYMVKNEEHFIRHSIESILPLVEQVIVFDTGSTDETVSIVKSVRSDKIQLYQKSSADPHDLIRYRNEMIRLTRTEWFMIVDGDEVYDTSQVMKIKEYLQPFSTAICRVQVLLLDFVKDAHLVANKRYMGKIFRTKSVTFVGTYPFEGPVAQGIDDIEMCSAKLPTDIICYHFSFLPRSSRDRDIAIRHWRKIPFPIHFYFGPLPDGVQRLLQPKKRVGVRLFLKFVAFNCRGFVHRWMK